MTGIKTQYHLFDQGLTEKQSRFCFGKILNKTSKLGSILAIINCLSFWKNLCTRDLQRNIIPKI